MPYNTLEEMIVAASEMVRPPERLTVAEAAEKYRYLNNPGSYVGMWDNDFAYYLVEPMEALTSLDHTGMIFVGPARCGKSDLMFNWLAHTSICDPADMMVIHMTQNTARDWSQGDLRKMLRHSKDVGKRLTPGRQNTNTHDVRFLSGMRLLIKWPTITELSGKTIPRLWLMDYDRMPLDIDKEGSPYALTKKRSQTFGRYGMTVAESSPGWEVDNPKWIAQSPHEAPPTKGILALYNAGDRRRWYWRCPHCDDPFEPDFSLLKWEDTDDKMVAAESAYLGCPSCGSVITHEPDEFGNPGKHELNRRGKWIKDGQRWLPDGSVTGTPVRSDTASFWLKGAAAAFADWKTLVFNYLKAYEEYEQNGSQEALKTTVNTDQGLPYTPKGMESDRLPEVLKARAQDLGDKVVPEGVRFLVSTIDVQKNMFVVQVHGFGEGGDITIVDRFNIKYSRRTDDLHPDQYLWVNPASYPEDWQILVDEVIEKSYPLADGSGREMQVKAIGCDSGGAEGVTANAYDFWRWLRDEHTAGHHKRFMLIKGASTKGAPRVAISYPDSERKDRKAGARGEVPVLLINTDQLKDQANAMLDRLDPYGGMVSFPDWLPDWFYSELTAENKTVKGWENPKKRRNEAWDLLTYSIAISLSRLVFIDRIQWDSPPGWAAEWDDNDLIFASGSNKKFESQQKGGYDLSQLAEQLA